jgi:hypothetical protein
MRQEDKQCHINNEQTNRPYTTFTGDLAEVLPEIPLASQFHTKEGRFKGVTAEGTVYITHVQYIGDVQHRYKQKVGDIRTM